MGRKRGARWTGRNALFDRKTVPWLPPVSPSKIVGLALNYGDHAESWDSKLLRSHSIFETTQFACGKWGRHHLSDRAQSFCTTRARLQWLSGKLREKSRAREAMEFVRGFTIANDVTLRDFITNFFRPPVKAKGFDTFCPLGPYIITNDEIADVRKLGNYNSCEWGSKASRATRKISCTPFPN